MKKTVPLVVYDKWGVKTVIGSADAAIHENGTIEISGTITDERYTHLISSNPDHYSIGLNHDEPQEVARVFPPAVQKES